VNQVWISLQILNMPRGLVKIQEIADAIRPLIPATTVDERLLVLSIRLADRLIGANWLDEPQRRQEVLSDWAIQLYPTLDEAERTSASRLNLESASHWFVSVLRSTFEDLKSPDFHRSNSG
jgi:hypothetical protein